MPKMELSCPSGVSILNIDRLTIHFSVLSPHTIWKSENKNCFIFLNFDFLFQIKIWKICSFYVIRKINNIVNSFFKVLFIFNLFFSLQYITYRDKPILHLFHSISLLNIYVQINIRDICFTISWIFSKENLKFLSGQNDLLLFMSHFCTQRRYLISLLWCSTLEVIFIQKLYFYTYLFLYLEI